MTMRLLDVVHEVLALVPLLRLVADPSIDLGTPDRVVLGYEQCPATVENVAASLAYRGVKAAGVSHIYFLRGADDRVLCWIVHSSSSCPTPGGPISSTAFSTT